MKYLTVTIKTLSPVVLTAMNNANVMTASRDSISGTVLRGVIASRYIEVQKLRNNAHLDEMFRRLFFGGLRFVDANPVNDGKRSIALPLSLQKAKVPVKDFKNEEILLDILKEKPQAGYKSLKGFGTVKGSTIEKIEVEKQVKLHMSRSGEKERISGRSLESGIYNYEAIAAGQEFAGIIVGEEHDLKILLEKLCMQGKSFICYIGRSRYTEYGKCQFSIGKLEKVVPAKTNGDTVYIRLETPWIPLLESMVTANVLMKPFLDKLEKALDTKDIVVDKIIGKAETVSNFVGVWGLKREERQAMAAGSVFAIKKTSGWSELDCTVLCELLYQGQGARTEEGYGQLRFWNVENPTLMETDKKEIARRTITSVKVKEIARRIVMQRILTRVRLKAEADVQKLDKYKVKNAAHTFARLESLLGKRTDLAGAKARFQTKMGELRDGSIVDKRLQSLHLNGITLKDILTGKAQMPYASLSFKEELPEDLVADIGFVMPSHDDGAVFYEYWLWFFRHGLKTAVVEKREKE